MEDVAVSYEPDTLVSAASNRNRRCILCTSAAGFGLELEAEAPPTRPPS